MLFFHVGMLGVILDFFSKSFGIDFEIREPTILKETNSLSCRFKNMNTKW